MLISLKNDYLSLKVDTWGAQMMSLTAGDTEYLWQGDEQYWADRAPTLFPYIGRLWNNSYCYRGKTYRMSIHGFAASSDFVPTQQGSDFVVLALKSNSTSRGVFPFDFVLNISYRLVGSSVEVSYAVRNAGENTMPFGIGGHPGFRVPIGTEETFEDY